jgi:hypothetical protein
VVPGDRLAEVGRGGDLVAADACVERLDEDDPTVDRAQLSVDAREAPALVEAAGQRRQHADRRLLIHRLVP